MNNNQRIYFNITKDQFNKLAFVIQHYQKHYQKLYPDRKITSNLIIGALINALFDNITKE